MATLKKYNLKGEEVGDVTVEDALLGVEANHQMIKDYIVALRANARQWSAHTKGRKEVNHTGKKPYRQKGTGNARQGCLAAPQFKGGGVVFGPKPKQNPHVRINKKERRLAIRSLLADKIKNNRIVVIEDAGAKMKAPKTKTIASFLKSREFQGKRLLFVGEGGNFKKSIQNLPGSAFLIAPNVNGYDLMAAQGVVMTESALKELMSL